MAPANAVYSLAIRVSALWRRLKYRRRVTPGVTNRPGFSGKRRSAKSVKTVAEHHYGGYHFRRTLSFN